MNNDQHPLLGALGPVSYTHLLYKGDHPMNQHFLQLYADFIVKVGVNVRCV